MKKQRLIKCISILAILPVLLLAVGWGHDPVENEYVSIAQYKNLEIELPEAQAITDEQVEREIHSLLAANSKISPISGRDAQEGDWVNIDYSGMIDGVAFEGGTASSYNLELGSGTFIPGFEDAIIGYGEGETFEFDLAFPDSYPPDESKAGVTAHWVVTVNSVFELTEPELTDEFVTNNIAMPGITTAEGFRSFVRERLEAQAQREADLASLQAAWEVLDANSTVNVDIPEGKTKQELVIEAIAEVEELQIDDAYYTQNLPALAERYGFSGVDELKGLYTEEQLKATMLQNRVLDFVIANANGASEEEMTPIDAAKDFLSKFPWWGWLFVAAAVLIAVLLIIRGQVARKRRRLRRRRE